MTYDTEKKAFIDAGHALITEGLAAAHAAGDANPRMPLKTVVMSVEQTLRDFFNHLMSIGEDAAGAALDAGAQKLEDDLADDHGDDLGGHPHDDNAADIEAKAAIAAQQKAIDEIATKQLAAQQLAAQQLAAKPLDPETVGAAPAKDPTLKVQG